MNRLGPNSTKEFNVYTVENPFAEDIAIKSLQAEFASKLAWLDKSFPRAVLRTTTIDTERGQVERRFPAVPTIDGNDQEDLLEQDNFSAYSFFYQVDPVNSINYEERAFNVYESSIRNIFWVNLNAIDPGRSDDFLLELESEILNVISNTRHTGSNNTTVRGVEVQRIYREPQNIFEGFSFDLLETQFLHYPYRGLRFDLNVTLSITCQ